MDERERLIEIMKSQELNSKQLSQELGVSAGTISNILGGRNKPSLEFLQNVATHFPFIDPTWLFLGYGKMYIAGYVPNKPEIVDHLFVGVDDDFNSSTSKTAGSLERKNENIPSVAAQGSFVRSIQKIVVFYSDGTFEER